MLQAPDGTNAEGYCKEHHMPLDIGGNCPQCDMDSLWGESSYSSDLRKAMIRIEAERNLNEFLGRYFSPTDPAPRGNEDSDS